MRKTLRLLAVFFISSLLLTAYGEDNTEQAEEVDNEDTEEVENDKSDSVEPEETEEETEDQGNLSVGDTGKFDSDLTTYEITLEDVKVVDELDGTTSRYEGFIILDLTVKNTGEDTQSVRDLLYGLEVTSDLDRTGYQDYADSFDSIEEMTGELEPGEEVSGQWLTEITEGDTQYFRLRSGVAGSGSSNQVTWVIPTEEVKQD